MDKLEPGTEVMLTGLAAAGAHMDGFNPYYGLVVKDLCDLYEESFVIVIWEDGRERKHPRNVLMKIPKEIGGQSEIAKFP